ncbi:MAG: TetR/AcrR family transcriptional regulator [Rhodospirillales bacterium]
MKDSRQTGRIREIAAGLFAAKGYNGVGVAEIGAATGLGRGALYHHIGSKEDLLYDIASRYIAELVESGRAIAANYPDPVERIHRLSRHLMRIVGQHLAEMTVCFREVGALTGEHYRTVSKLHSDYQQIWEDAIVAGAASGDFRPVDRIAVKGLLGMFFYSFLWLKPGGDHAPEEIGDIFSDLVIRSLAADQSRPRGPLQ